MKKCLFLLLFVSIGFISNAQTIFSTGFEGTSEHNLPEGWTTNPEIPPGDVPPGYWIGAPGFYTHNVPPVRIYPHSGTRCAHIDTYLIQQPIDAWMMSPPISLTAGNTYEISFWTILHNDYFELKIRKEEAPIASGTQLYSTSNVTFPTWTLITEYFTPDESGDYVLGFRCTNSPWTGEYIGIDDITVSLSNVGGATIDGEVIKFVTPVAGTYNNLTNNEEVTITIRNNGEDAISNFNLELQLNNGTPITELYTGVVAAKAQVDYTFTSKLNLSAAGTYEITAKIIVSGDEVPDNDSKTVIVKNNDCQAITSFPWQEGFENNGTDLPDCWVSELTGSGTAQWAIVTTGTGVPASVHSGTHKARFIDGVVQGHSARITTPQLDLSGVSNPVLTFWHTQQAGTPAMNQDHLEVYYKTSKTGEWVLLEAYTENVSAWTERKIVLPNASADYYVAFKAINHSGAGGVQIDDITIADLPVCTVTLSANPPEGGYATGEGDFLKGDPVTVIAGVYPGFSFVNWTENGEPVSSSAAYSFIIENNRDLTANFVSNDQQYAVNYNTPENGILYVTADGNPVESGTMVDYGTELTITATPDDDYKLLTLTVNGNEFQSGNSYTVISTTEIVAAFVSTAATIYTVTLSANPPEGGYATGEGDFFQGDPVTVIAGAYPDFSFVNWTENGEPVSSNAAYSFIIESDRDLTANFVSNNQQYAVNYNTPENGTLYVTANDNTVESGTMVDYGTELTITATPDEGYKLLTLKVNGNEFQSGDSYTVVSTTEIVATFVSTAATIYTVTLVANPVEGGTVSGAGNFEAEEEVTVTATANNKWEFKNWTMGETVVSEGSVYTFTITGDVTLTANFIPEDGIKNTELPLNISIYPNPVKETLHVCRTSNEKAQIEIYNSIGILLHAIEINKSEVQLDLSSLPSGMYIIRFIENKDISAMKFVKE